MERRFTERAAKALVGKTYETHRFLGSVPKGMRGQVIEALDVGDHWNVLIEWQSPRIKSREWYDRYDVETSMRLVQAVTRAAASAEDSDMVEIQSSHDLTAPSPDARRTGAHSYRLSADSFTSGPERTPREKGGRRSALCLTTLDRERIWISESEWRKVVAAVQATRYRVVLD